MLYGLFHGLVFLPVLLSLLGPAPYPTAQDDNPQETEEMCAESQQLHQQEREEKKLEILSEPVENGLLNDDSTNINTTATDGKPGSAGCLELNTVT